MNPSYLWSLCFLFSILPATAGEPPAPYLVVLGTAQDAGFPQAACKKSCCTEVWLQGSSRIFVSCLGLLDAESGGRWMFDATPDFKWQLDALDRLQAPGSGPVLSGVFLTHGHMGHYTGLMHLGREAMGAREVPVYAMPRMVTYLRENGPWSQLVGLRNIAVKKIQDGSPVSLNTRLKVTPFLVPHRDEFTETVGYRIEGPSKTAVFIPDIDKWEKWSTRIEDVIASVDYALVDGTFYDNAEIPHRDMSEIPHPFIAESMARLKDLPAAERAKVIFIHLNHTNAALNPDSPAGRAVTAAGFRLAVQGMKLTL
ncbi:MAG: MBL fold metallo-hydrolase [Acidobacteriota bacterium]|nr:MBL fold metallo-hydrolase [Acidobacteriota bacterium]